MKPRLFLSLKLLKMGHSRFRPSLAHHESAFGIRSINRLSHDFAVVRTRSRDQLLANGMARQKRNIVRGSGQWHCHAVA